MFFIGVFGASSAVRPLPDRPPMRCPVCGAVVPFAQSWQYDYLHAFFLPVFKYGHHIFLTCSSCASVFGTTEEKAKLLAKEPLTHFTEEELILLRNNHVQRCPDCGRPRRAEDDFCGGCGRRWNG